MIMKKWMLLAFVLVSGPALADPLAPPNPQADAWRNKWLIETGDLRVQLGRALMENEGLSREIQDLTKKNGDLLKQVEAAKPNDPPKADPAK